MNQMLLTGLRASTGVLIGLLVVVPTWANEPSPAEQAAQAAMQPVARSDRLLALCRHALLYGTEDQKAEVLAHLGDKTCAEAYADGLFDPSNNP